MFQAKTSTMLKGNYHHRDIPIICTSKYQHQIDIIGNHQFYIIIIHGYYITGCFYRLFLPIIFTGYFYLLFFPVIFTSYFYRLFLPVIFTGYFHRLFLPVVFTGCFYRLFSPFSAFLFWGCHQEGQL